MKVIVLFVALAAVVAAGKRLRCPADCPVKGPKLQFALGSPWFGTSSVPGTSAFDALRLSPTKGLKTSASDIILTYGLKPVTSDKQFMARKFVLVSKGAVMCRLFFHCPALQPGSGLEPVGNFRRNKLKLKSSCKATSVDVKCTKHKKADEMIIRNIFANTCVES